MDKIERFRWELIADETIDRAFAEAGGDELLAQALEQLEAAAAESKGDEGGGPALGLCHATD